MLVRVRRAIVPKLDRVLVISNGARLGTHSLETRPLDNHLVA